MAIATMLMTLFCSPSNCGQVNESEACDLAKASTRSVLGGGHDMFVSSRRDINLEKEFSAFCDNSQVQVPYIFRNSVEGTEIKGRVTITHASIPSSPDFIIAVSASGIVFNIRSGINSKKEIENLCLYYKITLNRTDIARKFLHFYIAVNPGNDIPQMLKSTEDLRSVAKSRIIAKFGEKAGDLLFNDWWQHHSRDIKNLNFDIHITETNNNHFMATFYVLSNLGSTHPEKGPAVLKVSLKLLSKGKVDDLKFYTVWR